MSRFSPASAINSSKVLSALTGAGTSTLWALGSRTGAAVARAARGVPRGVSPRGGNAARGCISVRAGAEPPDVVAVPLPLGILPSERTTSSGVGRSAA